MEKNIFWLVSYPKSGNTLLRSILISLFFTNDGNFNLKMSNKIDQFESTRFILNNKDLFGEDINKLGDIAIFFKYITKLQSKEALGIKEDFVFKKSHSGLFEIGNNAFTNTQNSRGIIYVVRDPRDVCISWSKHSGLSIQESIDFLTNDYAKLHWVDSKKFLREFREDEKPKSFLSSWEKHVLSWTKINWNIPKLIIKFEDLVYDKEFTIRKLVEFFKLNFNFNFENLDRKIDNILLTTEFEKLKEEEKKNGFIEATEHSNFFSVGEKYQWENKLEAEQILQIEEKFKDVMKSFGYNLVNKF